MLLMVEKDIRCESCHAVHPYPKPNDKYVKDYYQNKKSSYRMYWDINNLYRWVMLQKLPVDGFKWRNSNYDEDSSI